MSAAATKETTNTLWFWPISTRKADIFGVLRCCAELFTSRCRYPAALLATAALWSLHRSWGLWALGTAAACGTSGRGKIGKSDRILRSHTIPRHFTVTLHCHKCVMLTRTPGAIVGGSFGTPSCFLCASQRQHMSCHHVQWIKSFGVRPWETYGRLANVNSVFCKPPRVPVRQCFLKQ